MLVHCHEGVSRSISLVLAHLMATRRWTLKRALEAVTRVRPQAQPNAGFLAQLLELDEQINGRKTLKVGFSGFRV